MSSTDKVAKGAVPEVVETRQRRAPDPDRLYAALDLGTNSCRMLIAQPEGGQLHVVDSFSKTVQLGAGLEQSGKLSRAGMHRTMQAIKICKQKLQRHNVSNMRLVATEACRRARNGAAFLGQVAKETGLRMEILPAEEEARLAVLSCAPLISPNAEQLLVVDIGGGSTELVWIDLSTVPPQKRVSAIFQLRRGMKPRKGDPWSAKVVDWISVPLGVATLQEQFEDVDDDSGRFALMSLCFEEHLEKFAPYHWDHDLSGFQMVGTSGTITTVAASYLGLTRYDRTKVDGLRMNSGQIEQVINEYLSLGPLGRKQDPRIGKDRQALIMSGAAILQALVRTWPSDRLMVADRGLREGLLYAQMNADGVLGDIGNS
ncbi:MAG: Ppx/GppA phosphatase family protein [Planktomarina sp.]